MAKSQSPGTHKTPREMEKNISNGFNPGCYLCGSELMIKEQDGNDGTKGFYYSCTNKEKCKLDDSFVKLSGVGQLIQALRKKVTVGLLGFIGGGILFGQPVIQNLFAKDSDSSGANSTVAEAEILQSRITELTTERNTLNIRVDSFANALNNAGNQDQALSFNEKYILALSYAGLKNDLEDNNIKNFNQAKSILFDLVDNSVGTPDMTDHRSMKIANALSNLRLTIPYVSDGIEIVSRIDRLSIPDSEKYIRKAEIFYYVGLKDELYRIQSLYYYLKYGALEQLNDQNKKDVNLQIDYLEQIKALRGWNQEKVQQLKAAIEFSQSRTIKQFANEVEKWFDPSDL